MAKVLPPKGFAGASLELHEVPAGQRFGRIYLGRYPDPLGFGKTPSRFSDPRRRVPANRFGVLYLGDTMKVCFLEVVLRDQRDGAVGDLPMEESELHARHYAEIEVTVPLKMVDLREDGAIVMGVPTDVAKASSQTLARAWSVAFHEHSEQPDGIIYPSRLNGHTNLAVFDRAIIKLRAVRKMKLVAAPGLATVLNVIPPFDRAGLPLRDIRVLSATNRCSPTGHQPSLDLCKVPHDASRRQRKAPRKLAALLHLVDRAIGERHDLPELMPSDRSWQAGQPMAGPEYPTGSLSSSS